MFITVNLSDEEAHILRAALRSYALDKQADARSKWYSWRLRDDDERESVVAGLLGRQFADKLDIARKEAHEHA